MKSSLDTSKLSVGSYSFKQLCDILDEHSYTAYNKSLENRWRRYFDYTYDAEKKLFHVTYIKAAEEILPREKYFRNEPSKYDILHPTLLLILKLNSMQKYKINFTKLNLWLYLGFINEKYIKYANFLKDRGPEPKEYMDTMEKSILYKFFELSQRTIRNGIKRAFEKIPSSELQIKTVTKVIRKKGDTPVTARKNTVDKIEAIKSEILQEFGCENEGAVFYRRKQKKFYPKLYKAVEDKLGIIKFYEVYEFTPHKSIDSLIQAHPYFDDTFKMDYANAKSPESLKKLIDEKLFDLQEVTRCRIIDSLNETSERQRKKYVDAFLSPDNESPEIEWGFIQQNLHHAALIFQDEIQGVFSNEEYKRLNITQEADTYEIVLKKHIKRLIS